MQDGESPRSVLRTRCVVAGGGPAGMVLGFLLARAGVDVVVLEKHADFFRDFRGDTIHPSTLQVMHELGLLDEFLKLPHQKVARMSVQVGDARLTLADFAHVPTRCKYIALMPQWDFLNFLAAHGKKYRGFDLRMKAEATDLIEEAGRVVGLGADTADGPLEIRADLVVGADGRHSTMREKAGFVSDDQGAPMDVLWFRLPRESTDNTETLGHIETGRMMIMLDRGDYWQCAYVIAKGGFDAIKAEGLRSFQQRVVAMSPFLADRMAQLASWDDVKLLSVAVDRLRQWWRPGLICIGDAAHAMSPIGGVGVNLAVQDAVAAANRLAEPLRSGRLTEADLAAIQRRRTMPVRATQRAQIAIQNRLISPMLRGDQKIAAPSWLKLLDVFPILRAIPAYLVGVGVRPEHVAIPEAPAP
ncbi:MAG TPA: FAD-dependent oxidoreductase [Beijerinckiaceae bacterium]|nr:FAD-dependent oxidoreductase [Beijerinckiaceae bacterium]